METCSARLHHRPGRAAGSRDAVSLLARFLYAEAGGESVRTREAIAATIANQVERLLSGTAASPSLGRGAPRCSSECLSDLARLWRHRRGTSDPIFASCWRIARRAVSGALHDPTGGAVRFHDFGRRPGWASGLNPSAWIGSYLFYADDEPADAPAGDGEQPEISIVY